MREHTGRPSRTSDFPCSWREAGGTKVLETQRRAASCPSVVINAGGRDIRDGTGVKTVHSCETSGRVSFAA